MSAACPALATASSRGIVCGSARRASSVEIVMSAGTNSAGRNSGSGSKRATTRSSTTIVNPPNTAAAALSGWP